MGEVMKLHLDESLFDVINESSYRGEGNLVFTLIDLINIICHSNLNPKGYMLHHKNYEHNDFHLENLILLPVYDKVIPGIQYKNPNSAIHSRFRDIDVVDEEKYKSFLHNIKALDTYNSILKGVLTYV